MYRAFLRVRFLLQVATLNVSFFFAGLRKVNDRVDWVVGPYEIAGIVYQLANALPSAHSVVLAPHPFYSHAYGWTPRHTSSAIKVQLRSIFLGPWILGRFARQARGFVYISAEGFLNSALDHRNYEFAFLKRHGLKIVCYFTGNDIRSPQLMKQLEQETGRPNLGTYLPNINAVFATQGYDDTKKEIAAAADKYADVIFNSEIDQRSYLTSPTHPFQYFHADDEVTDSFAKFDNYQRPVIVHAPSSPILKGTALVRAAIDQLRQESLDFEYIELSGLPHEKVKQSLDAAHIVLNQFYSYVPGVFGIEAMAAGCAMMVSADEHLEPQLPAGTNDSWVVTEHFAVADRLRELLLNREYALAKAKAGRDWVRKHAVASVSGAEVSRILNNSLESRE